MDTTDIVGLIKQHHHQIKKTVKRTVKNESLVDDIVQEVCIKIYIYFQTNDMPTNISAWITTVSKNTATDHLRKIQRNNHLLNHLQQEAIFHNCSEWNPESEALLKQMIEYVQNALNEMGPNTKKIILLRQQGLSYTEIAQQMNLPKNTVKTKIFRGRKQLMTFLQKNGVFQNDL